MATDDDQDPEATREISLVSKQLFEWLFPEMQRVWRQEPNAGRLIRISMSLIYTAAALWDQHAPRDPTSTLVWDEEQFIEWARQAFQSAHSAQPKD